jgi:hypothetical protein
VVTEAEKQLEASLEQTRAQLTLQIQQGQDSRLLLTNPVLEAWFKDSEVNLLGLVDTIPLNDTVARDRIYTTLTLLRKLKTSLQQFVEDGEVAEKDWKQLLELNKKGFLGGIFGD